MSARASPQTPLEELTALPQTPIWFQLRGPLRGRRGMEGRTREEEGRAKGEWGKRGKGEVWGNSALVVGG